MFKRYVAIVLLCLLAVGGALAEALQPSPTQENVTVIADTGYQITLPQGWQTATQPDPHRAVVEAVNPAGNLHILVFINSQPDWSLRDWQAALTKASKSNSVTDIGELTVLGRQWVAYRMALDHTKVFATATDIGGGSFVTVEFRAEDDSQPEAAYPDGAIDACLGSLQPSP
jgi:hypothetical protein